MLALLWEGRAHRSFPSNGEQAHRLHEEYYTNFIIAAAKSARRDHLFKRAGTKLLPQFFSESLVFDGGPLDLIAVVVVISESRVDIGKGKAWIIDRDFVWGSPDLSE